MVVGVACLTVGAAQNSRHIFIPTQQTNACSLAGEVSRQERASRQAPANWRTFSCAICQFDRKIKSFSIRLLAEMVHPALCDTTCWCLSVLFAPALAGGLSTAVYGGLVFRFKFVGGESWRQQELLLMLLGVPGSLSSLHHGVFHRKRDRIPQ